MSVPTAALELTCLMHHFVRKDELAAVQGIRVRTEVK